MAKIGSEVSLLLYCIAYECKHNGTATLQGMLAAEDAINRSASTFVELTNGLDILLSAGLIVENGQEYTVTPEGERIYIQTNKQQGNIFERLAFLLHILQSELAQIPVNHRCRLNRQSFQRAYENYYHSVNE